MTEHGAACSSHSQQGPVEMVLRTVFVPKLISYVLRNSLQRFIRVSVDINILQKHIKKII